MAKIAKLAKLIMEIPMKGKEEFLTIKQTSEYLGIPLRTVYRLKGQGKIRAIRIGGKIRCLKTDVEKHYNFGTDFSVEPVRKNPQFIERRTSPRINSNFICQYSVSLPPFKSINDAGIIKNLSAGGILLFNQKKGIDKVNVDDPINLIFTLAPKVDVDVTGKVVRKKDCSLGIRFKNLSDYLQKRITEYAN